MEHKLLSKLNMLLPYILLLCDAFSSSTAVVGPQAYIIHMDKSMMSDSFSTAESWHLSLLSDVSSWSSSTSVSSEREGTPIHLYSYNHVMQGFSAVLHAGQLDQIKQHPGYVTSYPDSYGKLHTTHSPKFLGLSPDSGLWQASDYGDGMIIGMIDTGIWPESESFRDDGMPPVPERWKGECVDGTAFNSSLCNRKLIGAKFFSKGLKQSGAKILNADDYDSPRDYEGHGSHTSSTAAGSAVLGANYFGYAPGTAIGIAPKAHIAMYKVLFAADTWKSAATDVLAGMDQAIADGVDLMSLSLGFFRTPYWDDVVAMGAFAAMEKGIFVSCSAGNDGPHAYTVINGAPWFTSVGAGTIDRDYFATITLGEDEKTVQGRSIFPENLFVSNVSLYYGRGNISKESCDILDPKEVAGKIVFCVPTSDVNVYGQMATVSQVGVEGAIFVSEDLGEFLFPRDFNLPYVVVRESVGKVIKKYIEESPKEATVGIEFIGTELGVKPAPQAAFFSSRGPSRVSPWILKPDVLAPGVNILASWVPNRGFAPIGNTDSLVTDYALASGTSMASPHVIGVAAMIKSVHRDWSPAAIRSAMMTTANITDNTGKQIIDMSSGITGSPLEYGAGHINPNKAVDPGLVYEISLHDYMDFLCALNYSSHQIAIITRKTNYACTKRNLDLNYPSFMVILNNTNTTSSTFKRVLTNVGDEGTSYRAVVKAPLGMKVVVKPVTISFGGRNTTQEFTVKVDIDLTKTTGPQREYLGNFGYLSWHEIGGDHVVRSPIVSAMAP